MTIRKCQNCEQLIGHLEESYYYYGRFVCRVCKIKFEGQLNPEAQTVKDSDTEDEDSPIDKKAATQLSNETFPQKEEPPDSQSLSSALPGCEQSENHNDLPPTSSDMEAGVRADG